MATDCKTMTDVRREIDRVDRTLVPLLLERLDYIRQAGHIKADRVAVRDEARIEDVINKVKSAAADADGHQGYIEDVFRMLIEWSIAYEFTVFDKK